MLIEDKTLALLYSLYIIYGVTIYDKKFIVHKLFSINKEREAEYINSITMPEYEKLVKKIME